LRANPVKHRLAAGEVVFGTMVMELTGPALFRIAGLAGAEFVLLDLEHPSWSLETVRGVIAAGFGTEVIPIVRVPDAEYHLVARALDAGTLGLMVPNCVSEAEARSIVEWAKYPPLGQRGVGIQRYELEPEGVAATLTKANAEQMVIAQIESVSGLEEVERIAAVDGIDVLWIGHYDLTTSLGIPGDFASPVFAGAVDRVVAACEAAGKAPGILAANVDEARQWLARGFRCVAYGIDAWLYEDALRSGLDALRG
jgi:2-dehydro-3-deoxyglucarate aldolase/4-hydroxy-2-oxoheptanedioate aldolase